VNSRYGGRCTGEMLALRMFHGYLERERERENYDVRIVGQCPQCPSCRLGEAG
jgi:hypothetical protein